MNEHTPTPWVVNCDCIYHIADGKATFTGLVCSSNDFMCQAGANAEYAVRAVNSHDELVERLATMTTLCRLKYGNLDAGVYQEIEAAEALITKARG